MSAQDPLEIPGEGAGRWDQGVGVREVEPGPAFEVHSFSEAEVRHLRFQSGMELPDPQRGLWRWGGGDGGMGDR